MSARPRLWWGFVLFACALGASSVVASAQPPPPSGVTATQGVTPAAPTAPTIDARVALHDFRELVWQQLNGLSRSLKVLASTKEIQSGDWTTMQPPMSAIAQSGVPANAIWFMRPDGSYETLEKGPTAATLADRPYYPTLMGGQAVEGYLVISRSTGRRSVVVAQPVRRQGQVIGAIGISISVDQLSQELEDEMQLPQGIVFYALDAHGQAALHRDPSLMFQFPADIGDPSLRSAVTQMLSTDQGTVHYQFRGVHKTVIYEKSPTLGWVFALGFPEAPAGVPQ